MTDDGPSDESLDRDNVPDGARVYGNARSTRGERYGVYGETDAGEGYGVYTPGDAGVDGALDAGALASPALAPDVVVYEVDDGTAYAVNSDGVLESGPETATVVQTALDAYPGGYVAQTSDITVESTLTLVNQRYDGFGHVIDSRVSDGDWTIVQKLDRPQSADGDDTADGADINVKILDAFSGIRNLHVDCKNRDTTGIDHQRKGIYTEDAIHATYENVAIYAPKVGWDVTDSEAWTEASVWNNVLIRNTFDAGMRVGSASFSCQFENVRISESGAGAVLLDLTDDGMASGREGNTIEHTQFENLVLWPAVNDDDNGNVTALRLDAAFSDVTFRGVQQHPGPDSTTLHVTSGASGSVTFEDSIFTDYVTVADGADLSMTFDTQPIFHRSDFQ